MSAKQPAMSPSGLPGVDGSTLRELLERAHAETRSPV